jgi:cyclopropane-fatty-acyl-phospholipid synthase
VTISRQQFDHARAAVEEAGLDHLVEIRLQDYRDISDGPFDAISSIGMFEHVGLSQLEEYFSRLKTLLRPEGRLLNHQIGNPPEGKRRFRKERTPLDQRGFIHRYVFPDGELHEVGSLVHAMQALGLEVRHVESLREHYARTLRFWSANLDANWAEASSLVGEGRARVWKLYMAGCAVMFNANRIQVHQILAVNVDARRPVSAMGWRPTWDAHLRTPGLEVQPSDDKTTVDLRDSSPTV